MASERPDELDDPQRHMTDDERFAARVEALKEAYPTPEALDEMITRLGRAIGLPLRARRRPDDESTPSAGGSQT